MLQIVAIILFLIAIALAVVTAIKRTGIVRQIRVAYAKTSLAALAVICQFVDMIVFDCGRWDIVMMAVYFMYMLIQVLAVSSLVEDMVRGERVD